MTIDLLYIIEKIITIHLYYIDRLSKDTHTKPKDNETLTNRTNTNHLSTKALNNEPQTKTLYSEKQTRYPLQSNDTQIRTVSNDTQTKTLNNETQTRYPLLSTFPLTAFSRCLYPGRLTGVLCSIYQKHILLLVH